MTGKILSSLRKKKFVIASHNRYFSLSPYGKIEIYDRMEDGVPVRLLMVNGTRQSATFIQEFLRNEPVFEYLHTVMSFVNAHPALENALLIGGAGFSLPKYYISRLTEKSMDVVESNPDMVALARQYFYLDELYETYNLEETERLRIFIEDGYRHLEMCGTCYDAIINDAFVGRVADRTLSSEQGCRLIYDHLKPGGIYLVNVITARVGSGAMPGITAQEIISRVFGSARMVPVRPEYPVADSQNVIIYAQKEG